MTTKQAMELAEQQKHLAKQLLLQMFNHDDALIEGWKRTYDARWLAALGFVTTHVRPAPVLGAGAREREAWWEEQYRIQAARIEELEAALADTVTETGGRAQAVPTPSREAITQLVCCGPKGCILDSADCVCIAMDPQYGNTETADAILATISSVSSPVTETGGGGEGASKRTYTLTEVVKALEGAIKQLGPASSLPSTHQSAPAIQAPHSSDERLPSSDAAAAGADTARLHREIERLRAALKVIAGSSDRVQAMQASAALDNIGAKV